MDTCNFEINQEQIQVKSENITDDEDEDLNYSKNSPSKTCVDSTQIKAVNGGDRSSRNTSDQRDENYFKKRRDQQKSDEPNRYTVGKKNISLRPCGAITVEPKFVCNICTMGFQRSNNYTIHMKKLHQISRDPTAYACPNCPRKYEFEYELKRHMKKYKPLEERFIFPCTQCDRKFLTRVHKNRHMKYVHENKRSFICEECGEALHTSTILKGHMLTHTDFSPFQCKKCGKCFKQKQRLKRHMEIHGDKHHCTQCDMRLSTSATLKKHLLVHIEGKPHKCEICDRAFKLKKTLKVHLNTHTGNKIYECEFCEKIFTSNSSLFKHKKKKHAAEFMEQKAISATKKQPSTLSTTKNLESTILWRDPA
ncbi:zinc finger protein 93-like [Eurosta solidaginis]|uniref:zinc finger protein 93-like n=1 Tax=Eurosta solidaginis TaxID=178769 RepID=UPI0035306907